MRSGPPSLPVISMARGSFQPSRAFAQKIAEGSAAGPLPVAMRRVGRKWICDLETLRLLYPQLRNFSETPAERSSSLMTFKLHSQGDLV